MTINDHIKLNADLMEEIEKACCSVIPERVGAMAQEHFQDNFYKSGFVNNGLTPWKRSIRQSGKGANAGRRTLIGSGNANLMNGIKYEASGSKVTIYNRVPYAPIHNWGGTIPITKRMRGYAWHRFFSEAGIAKNDKPDIKKAKIAKASSSTLMWRNLALSKKSQIKMPQRQFIGNSRELNDKLHAKLETELRKILDKYNF